MLKKFVKMLLVSSLFGAISFPSQAQIFIPTGKFLLSEPTKLDIFHTDRQRKLIDDLARRNLGTPLRGDKSSDIRTLQRLLDSQRIAIDDTATLQAMGVALGDLLAKEMRLDWVIFEDKNGRNRALRYKDRQEVLFPITMISRRAEVSDTRINVDVQAIFDKAVESYSPLLPKLPYSD